MTFDQVLVFHRIIQAGSFKAAAEQLFKTQPAISFAMKKLEEELQVDLFDRSGHKPTLTEHGKAFYERSIKVLQGMSELENLSQSFRNQEEPSIEVAIDGISPLPHILKTFKFFNDLFPNTKINLGFDILSGAERRVLDKSAAIGISHFISDPHALELKTFTHVRMIPVVTIELMKEKEIRTQEDLLQIEQIVVKGRMPTKDASFGLLEGGRKWFLNDPNFKQEIILAGLGWGHLPEHSIHRELKEKKLIILEFEDIHPRKLEINLIRLKKHQFGPVAHRLWDELSSLA